MLTKKKNRANDKKAHKPSGNKQQTAKSSLQSAIVKTNELLRHVGIPDQIHDAIIITDLDGIIIKWSKGAQRLLGYKEDEMLGKHMSIIYPDSSPDISQSKILGILKRKRNYTFKTRARKKSGKFVYTHSSLSLFTDPSGTVVGIISYSLDITTLKQTESALDKTKRALKVLNQCNLTLIHALDEVNLLNDVCEIIVEEGGYRLAWVGYAEHDKAKTIKPVTKSGYEDKYIKSLKLTWADKRKGRGPVGTAIRTKKTYIARNILTDPDYRPWRDEARSRGYASAVAFPLIVEQQAIGAISIYAPEPDAFDRDELELLENLAKYLAYGINMLRKEKERKQSDKLQSKHNKVLAQLARSKELTEGNFNNFIKVLTKTSAQALDIERVSVWLFNKQHTELYCTTLYELSIKNHTEGNCLDCNKYPEYFKALEKGRVIAADDAHTDPATYEFSKDYLIPLGITSMMDVPIRVEGQILGVVCHEHVGPLRRWTLEEQDFAGSIADFTALVYESQERLKTEKLLQKQSRSIELLQRITVAANEAINVNDALQVCIDEVCQYTGWPIGHVYMKDPGNADMLISSMTWHLDHPRKHNEFCKTTEAMTFKSGVGLPGGVLASGHPIWINDPAKLNRSRFPRVRVAKKIGIKSAFAFPVLIGNETVAVLEFFSTDARDLDDNFLALMSSIGTQLGRVIERYDAEVNLQQYAEIIGQINDAVIVTDLEGCISKWNKGAEKLLGYTEKDILGKNIKSIYPRLNRKINQHKIIDILKKEGRYEFETLMRKKTGDDFYAHTSLSLLTSPEGDITGVINYSLDISERKRAEHVIRQAKLIDQIHDAVITTNLDAIITSWNRGAEKQFGYTAKQIVGRPIYVLYPGEKELYRTMDVVKILKGKGNFDIETLMRKKTGQEFYTHNSISLLYNEEGKVDGIISYSIDITERKKIEKELEKYRTQLEILVQDRTEELELTQSSLISKNRNLSVLSQCNKALVHATDEQQLLDDICRIIVETGNYKMAWVGHAEQDERKTVRPVSQWGYEKGYTKNINITWSEDSEFSHGPTGFSIRTGTPYVARDIHTDPNFTLWRDEAIKRGFASSTAIPLVKDDFTYGAIMIYAQEADSFGEEEMDILTELANNLTFGILALRTKDELVQKERLAVLGQLIATVSHELRNPLGTIRSSIYTIENTASNHDINIDKQIQRIERNIYRCDNIIDELLDYTRIRDLELQPTKIDAWLTNELNEFKFPDKVTVIQKFESDAIVNIEHNRFHRCLINILNNSCQAMEQNNDSSNQFLTVETNTTQNRLNICISDSGSGIPTNELNKIFEPLYSTKTYGVGLGLPIVKQIMELHGGNIEINSEPGHRTTIQLWLPLKLN